MKTNFENIGGSYSQQGDYLLPNLTLLDENQRQISVWAIRHRRYLKSSHRVLYYNLLTSGKLYNYLADVERQTENLFEQTIKSLAEQEQVTEKLKAENMMLWVQKMNNIRNRATNIFELVLEFWVFSSVDFEASAVCEVLGVVFELSLELLEQAAKENTSTSDKRIEVNFFIILISFILIIFVRQQAVSSRHTF